MYSLRVELAEELLGTLVQEEVHFLHALIDDEGQEQPESLVEDPFWEEEQYLPEVPSLWFCGMMAS